MRQTELSLNRRDRQIVDEFRSKGLHMAREFNRAHILAALDRSVPERQIMEVLNVGRTALWRTRAAYLKGGVDFALHDEARPGKPKRYGADAEAQVTALACSAPPPGAQRWTVALLT
ncbi:MAG: helix-turn-helix domain-containing protein [Gammaproteobacteria bacterium]